MCPALHIVHDLDNASESKQAQAQKLAFLFAHECGFRVLPWMERKFSELLNEGFEYNLLMQFVAETAEAPRPSWAYYRAIVSRCRDNDVYTVAQNLRQCRKRDDPNYNTLPLDIDPELVLQAMDDYKPLKEGL